MAQFHRPVRPRLRTGEYIKIAAGIGTVLATMILLAGGSIVGAPVHVTLRAVSSPVLRFFLTDADLIGWMAQSAWIQQAPWIFLTLVAGISAIVLILLWPSSKPVVHAGQRRAERSELQAVLDAEIAREEKKYRKSGA